MYMYSRYYPARSAWWWACETMLPGAACSCNAGYRGLRHAPLRVCTLTCQGIDGCCEMTEEEYINGCSPWKLHSTRLESQQRNGTHLPLQIQ